MRTRAEADRQRWAILGFAVAILVLSFVVLKSAYYQLVLTQVLLWAVLSLAWNILSGYSGYFSFGHAAFWGLGAYTVALGMITLGLPPWVTIPFCAVVGSVAGAIIGYPTFRLRGHYFALAMLAYPLATLYVFQWLGYQELTLPMRRDASRISAFMSCWRSGSWSRRSRSRYGSRIPASACRCWRSSRTSRPPRPPASTPGAGRCWR